MEEMRIPPSLLGPLSRSTRLIQDNPEDHRSLDRALEELEKVVSSADFVTADPSFQVMCYSVVAAVYELRYQLAQDLEDLDGQIEFHELALPLLAPGSPDRLSKQADLAGRLIDREARTGAPSDINRALSLLREVIREADEGSPEMNVACINMASGLSRRFSLLGDAADLDEAIATLREVAGRLRLDDRQLPVALSLLGTTLFERYQLDREREDLLAARTALERSLSATATFDPYRPLRVANLGGVLLEEFEQSRDRGVLDETIETLEEAVGRLRAPHLQRFLMNLGLALERRHSLGADPQDLEQAIAYSEAVLDNLPAGNVDRLHVLARAGSLFMKRFRLSRDRGDLEEAIDLWQELLEEKDELAANTSIPQGLYLGLRWASVVPDLAEAWAVASDLTTGEESTRALHRALEVAEGAKAPLLTQLAGRSMLRTPPQVPEKLRKVEADLLEEVRKVDVAEVATLGPPGTEIGSIRDSGADALSLDEAHSYPAWIRAVSEMLLEPDERIRHRSQALQELEALWDEMSALGGAAAEYAALRRQSPLTWDEITDITGAMPPGTAVLMLVATSARTLAFVLGPGSEPAMLTAGLNREDWSELAAELFEEMASDEPGPEPDAWMRPVAALLRQAQAHLSRAVRLVIVPDGAGHLVPWPVVTRAAGLASPGGGPLPVVVLPSLQLLPLLRSRAAALEGLPSRPPLVAGNPTGELPWAEEEARRVANRLGAAPMLRSDATRMEVVVRLSEFSPVHFAAHARFDRASPLDSGIVFSDGVLSARDAIVGELSADLLVLSGCQTGVAHGVTGEELANLAHAFLAAGARSLLVTLWEVDDVSTAQLMDSFYGATQHGQDKAQALATAPDTVRVQPEYADPYYWGGVILLGDWE